MRTRAVSFWVPLTLVSIYRLAPDRVRGMRFWPGSSGPSTSHLAVAWMWQGMNGWSAIGRAVQANGDTTRPRMP